MERELMQRAAAESLRDACLERGWDVTVSYVSPGPRHPQAPKDQPQTVNCSVQVSHRAVWTTGDIEALLNIAKRENACDYFQMVPGEGMTFR